MAVAEDTAAAAPAAPSAPIPKRVREERRPPRITVGGVMRFLVFAALAAFLLYYVGPRDMAETAIKVALIVVLTAALWVGANLLFDQAYDHWTRFNTIIGVTAGFLGYFVAEANGLFRSLYDKRVRFGGQGVFDDVSGWRTQPFGHQRPALGSDRRRRPRPRDVPAQRAPPAVGALPAGGGGVRRLRVPLGVRVRRVGVSPDRLDEVVGLRRCRRGAVRLDRPLALGPRGCPAVGPHRSRRGMVRGRVGRRRGR